MSNAVQAEQKKPVEHTEEQLAFIKLVQEKAFPLFNHYFSLNGTGVFALNPDGEFEFVESHVAFNIFLKGVEYAKQS